VTKVSECSCRYNEDIREHATVRNASRRYHNREDIELESHSCLQNVCRLEAVAVKDLILVASRFRLQQFFWICCGGHM
jgi:hypothetical protein